MTSLVDTHISPLLLPEAIECIPAWGLGPPKLEASATWLPEWLPEDLSSNKPDISSTLLSLPPLTNSPLTNSNSLTNFFQWAADELRVRLVRQLNDSAIVTQAMYLILPWCYDDSAVPDWDHDQMFEFEGVHAEVTDKPTSNLDVVTMSLTITPEIAKQIPRAHLPHDFKFGRGSMLITITIHRKQIINIKI